MTIRFRGRQITHSEIGREVMKQFAERIKEYGQRRARPFDRRSQHDDAHCSARTELAPTKREEEPSCPSKRPTKGAAKRFVLTKSGKVKRAQAFKRHILTKKPTKRTRNLRKAAYLTGAEARP